MRGLTWRRHQVERIVLKRIRRLMLNGYSWHYMKDVNKIKITKQTVSSFLKTEDYFNSKTLTTTYHDSKYKVKYSPNRSYIYRDRNGKNKSTREFDKREFLKMLKENGLK